MNIFDFIRQISELNAQNQKLKADISYLHDRHVDLQAYVFRLIGENENLERELERQKVQLSTMTGAKEYIIEERDKLMERLKKSSENNQKLILERDAAQIALQDIRKS